MLPGTAQFLSGRRLEGFGMGLLFLLIESAWLLFLMHPSTPWSVLDPGASALIPFVFWLIIVADGFRHPIQRLGVWGWARVLLLCVGVPILAALMFRAFVCQPFKIPTGAMYPTLKGKRIDACGKTIPGDHVWVSRLEYSSSAPRRGDVVVFKTKGLPLVHQDSYFVKRVVGLPGETVGIDPPFVTVNGTRMAEPPIFRRIAARKGGYCGYIAAGTHMSNSFCLATPTDRVTLGPTEYLVLGDNSTNSFDGRYYGPVQRNAIIGKVVCIYAPADRKKWLD